MTAPQTAPRLPAPRATWLAHPVLSVLLGASWLALSHSLALVHLLSALLIGLIVPRLLHPFLAPANRIDWMAALRLSAVVLKDIVLSNITVARLVLGPMSRPQPAWLPVPLATDHPRINALFATIITTILRARASGIHLRRGGEVGDPDTFEARSAFSGLVKLPASHSRVWTLS